MARWTHRTLFELVFPGLIDRVDALPGDYIEPTIFAAPQYQLDSDGVPRVASFALRKHCEPRLVVQIAARQRRTSGFWRPEYGSYHCGPDPLGMDEVFFRIDFNKAEPNHCHIRGHGLKPEKGGHIEWRRVEPPPRKDPHTFMDLVELYVNSCDRDIPLKVVRP